MKQFGLWLLSLWLLAGCGRVITPTPEPTFTVAPTAITEDIEPTATPQPPKPTATPRRATPRVSPTPTATPTPIIYTIQPGDTLLKIAIQFNSSTESIQEINGIADPRFLQIGQILIIPPAEESADRPPSPTPTPPPLEVTSINFQQTPDGALWCLGTIHNPGEVPLAEVVVEAALLDGTGVLLSREAAYTQLDVIQPGHSVPFAILFATSPGDFAQYQVVAVAGVPLSEQTRYYFDLQTFDVRGASKGDNTYRVGGQLRNHGLIDAEAIRLVVVAYDDEDRALAQRQVELAVSLLKAGAATSFEIDLIIPAGAVDHYEVLAQGLQVP